MSIAAKPHSLAHDALAVITGLGLLAFFYGLLAFAYWLRFDEPMWGVLAVPASFSLGGAF